MKDPFLNGDLQSLKLDRKNAVRALRKHGLTEEVAQAFVSELQNQTIYHVNHWYRRLTSVYELDPNSIFKKKAV
jgi:hypothetical protein